MLPFNFSKRLLCCAVLLVVAVSVPGGSAKLATADMACDVEARIAAHNGALPFQYIHRSGLPVDDRMMDYEFYSFKTPHSDFPESVTDAMYDELCGKNRLDEVLRFPREFTARGSKTVEEQIQEKADAHKTTGAVVETSELLLEDTPTSKSIPQPTTMMELAISDIKVPIYGPIFFGVDLSVDLITQRSQAAFSGELMLQLGITIKVFEIYAFVQGDLRLTANPQGSRYPTTGNMFMTTFNYLLWNNVKDLQKKMEDAQKDFQDRFSENVGPVRKSSLLSSYTEAFKKEYIDIFSDEWLFVTGGTQTTLGLTDKEILEAMNRIDRMMSTSPVDAPPQAPAKGIVWHFTDVSLWHPTTWGSSKLWFLVKENDEWTWSPDGENWMPLTQLEVSGGIYRGRKPTEENQKLINALHVIYQKNGGVLQELQLAELDSQLALGAGVRWDCNDCDHAGFGRVTACKTYCYSARKLNEGYNYAAEKVTQGANYVAEKATQGYNYVAEKATQGYNYAAEQVNKGIDKLKSVWDDASKELSNAGKRLWNTAKTTFSRFRSLFSRFKEYLKGTNAFRVFRRAMFSDAVPKRPSLVFENLYNRMLYEGAFGNTEIEPAVRGAMYVDSIVFDDMTRRIKVNEALYGFAFENRAKADIIQARMDAVMERRKAQYNCPPTHAFCPIKPTNGFIRGHLDQVRDAKVMEQLKRLDPEGMATLDDEQKKKVARLYATIALDMEERFAHLKNQAKANADALKASGDKTWNNMNDEDRKKIRGKFIAFRIELGRFVSTLREINQGDSFLTKVMLASVKYVTKKLGTYFGDLTRETAKNLREGGVQLEMQAELMVGIGLHVGLPKVKAGVDVKVKGGYIPLGFAAIVNPENVALTKTSGYTGWGGKLQGKFGEIEGEVGMFYLTYKNAAFCRAKYSGSTCKDMSIGTKFKFPGSLGMTPENMQRIWAAILGVGTLVTAGTTDHSPIIGPMQKLLYKILPIDFAKSHCIPTGTTQDWEGAGNIFKSLKDIIFTYGTRLLTAVTGKGAALRLKGDAVLKWVDGKFGVESVDIFPGLTMEGDKSKVTGLVIEGLKAAMKNIPGGVKVELNPTVGILFRVMDMIEGAKQLLKPSDVATTCQAGNSTTQAALAVSSDECNLHLSAFDTLRSKIDEHRGHWNSHNVMERSKIMDYLTDLEDKVRSCFHLNSQNSDDNTLELK